MQIFYSEAHKLHSPPFELFDGGQRMPYLETPDRMERILFALKERDWAEMRTPEDFGLDPILAVHDADYVDFLRTAYEEWTQEETTYEKTALLPATFPPRGWSHRPKSLLGRAGYHMFDLSAPIMGGTYQAALGSANCASERSKSHRKRRTICVCAMSSAGAPCGEILLRRILLPEQRRRCSTLAIRTGESCPAGHRLPRREWHAGYFLRPWRCTDHLHPRRPGRGISRFLRLRR